jgi:hypothetical protein
MELRVQLFKFGATDADQDQGRGADVDSDVQNGARALNQRYWDARTADLRSDVMPVARYTVYLTVDFLNRVDGSSALGQSAAACNPGRRWPGIRDSIYAS